MKSVVYNRDCLEAMREMPDRAFDLAIVDPPYGIGNFVPQHNSYGGVAGKNVKWNDEPPPREYFAELERVSAHRIIWGANYYNVFEPNKGAIVWYKGDFQSKFSACEIASQTIFKKVDYIHINWQSGFFRAMQEDVIHACQKPVALYKWLLTNYAKEGDTILDTHLGSGSSRIAAYDLGFDFTGYELDKDYFDAQEERFKNHIAQPKLFEPQAMAMTQGALI